MQVAELHEALGHLKARTVQKVTPDQLAYFESRKLAHTVSHSYFSGILADAHELRRLSAERARLLSVAEHDLPPRETRANANYTKLLKTHTSGWHRLFSTRRRLRREEQILSRLQDESRLARTSREEHVSTAEKHYKEYVAKRTALEATEEWRLWDLDWKAEEHFRNAYGIIVSDFAAHLQAQYKTDGEAPTRITLIGLMVWGAIQSIGLRLVESIEADLLIELVQAVVSQNYYHSPQWKDEKRVVDVLTEMRDYRERAIEYEITYTPPVLDNVGYRWEDNQGEHRHSYDDIDESMEVLLKDPASG